MKIQIATDSFPLEFSITTIGITTDSTNPYRTYMVHCYLCGKTQVRLQGKITRIIPWLEPTDKAIIVDGCRRCGWAFTMQQTEPSKTVLVRVPANISKVFCVICGHEIKPNGLTKCTHCHMVYDMKKLW